MKQLLLSLIFIATATIANAQSLSCNDPSETLTVLNANGDISCSKGNSSYTLDSQATATAKAQAQAAADAITNKPENKFNKDTFDGQLGQTILATNPTLLTMVGALDRFIDFKNFQAIANVVAGMFQAGELTQNEVDTFKAVMMNQQINLETYNSVLIDNSEVINATSN